MSPLLLSLVLTAADAGTIDPHGPASWTLSQHLAPGMPERETLLRELTASGGYDAKAIGETPLTRAEAEALLDDPRAQKVYGEKTVGIVAPSMITRQRQDHLDLMKLFLLPERIEAGAAFEQQRRAVFDAEERKHHVDREAIIGILMWESKLGTITGDWNVFNVFTSQAYFISEASTVAMAKLDEKKLPAAASQEKRVATIRDRAHKNLLALLRQCKTKGIDPLSVKGSWAGALGYPQFMPASLRWADDGNGDGVIDLFDFDDAIFSVGRYLSAHGWEKSQKTAVWDYNHEDAYVQGVLAFADALRARAAGDGGIVDAGVDAGSDAGAPTKH
jgi:membrane-bound lytic murein transglycosylase B